MELEVAIRPRNNIYTVAVRHPESLYQPLGEESHLVEPPGMETLGPG